MRGTGIEKEVEICARDVTNKTKCLSTNAKKVKKNCEHFFIVGRKYCKYKNGLGNAHPA
jgi:hypothetical protein